jgi:hypothetical protein
MGQAGLFCEELLDEYSIRMKKEYVYLSQKLGLHPIRNTLNYMRMRPSGFPTIRLSQLSGFVHANEFLFSTFLNQFDAEGLRKKLSVAASAYWDEHYRFNAHSKTLQKNPGKDFTDGLIINVVIPLVFAFGIYHSDEKLKGKALELLDSLPAENNKVVRDFRKLGWGVDKAFDSQSLLELKKKYCEMKRCLECQVGKEIFSTKSASKISSAS